MEELSKLVDASLARYGVAAGFDHLLLEWSGWFRCESAFRMLPVAAKSGIFVLAEEVVFAGASERPADGERRVLEVFHVGESQDLALALGRLFLPGSAVRERLASGRSFARYAVIEDRAERSLAATLFRRWMEADLVAGEGGHEAAKASGSERFIIRFPLQAASRARRGQAADATWPGAGKAQTRVSGLAASPLPSGF